MTTAGHGQRERQRVLEVRERRPQAAEQRAARDHAIRSSWKRAGELDRLDALGDELGPPRHRREAELVARRRRQPAQQVLDVRLVAGALAAEHVRVDDDERASRDLPRRPSTVARGDRAPT